jgi:hypothetical protein
LRSLVKMLPHQGHSDVPTSQALPQYVHVRKLSQSALANRVPLGQEPPGQPVLREDRDGGQALPRGGMDIRLRARCLRGGAGRSPRPGLRRVTGDPSRVLLAVLRLEVLSDFGVRLVESLGPRLGVDQARMDEAHATRPLSAVSARIQTSTDAALCARSF